VYNNNRKVSEASKRALRCVSKCSEDVFIMTFHPTERQIKFTSTVTQQSSTGAEVIWPHLSRTTVGRNGRPTVKIPVSSHMHTCRKRRRSVILSSLAFGGHQEMDKSNVGMGGGCVPPAHGALTPSRTASWKKKKAFSQASLYTWRALSGRLHVSFGHSQRWCPKLPLVNSLAQAKTN
jgi:hypothetical protein